jgi:hypothetical protein
MDNPVHIRSWDSSVGIATGYGLDDGRFGVRDPVSSKNILQAVSGPNQPPLRCVRDDLSPGVKRPEREAHHIMAQCLVKRPSCDDSLYHKITTVMH